MPSRPRLLDDNIVTTSVLTALIRLEKRWRRFDRRTLLRSALRKEDDLKGEHQKSERSAYWLISSGIASLIPARGPPGRDCRDGLASRKLASFVGATRRVWGSGRAPYPVFRAGSSGQPEANHFGHEELGNCHRRKQLSRRAQGRSCSRSQALAS